MYINRIFCRIIDIVKIIKKKKEEMNELYIQNGCKIHGF